MSSLDTKKTLQNLLQKGFVENSGDHKFLEFWHNDKLVLHTKISRGSSKDIGISLVSQMAHQCKLSNNQFIQFAKCSINKEEYIKILSKNGLLD
ncbi:MAG TPA: hypothetical protein PKK00_06225 [Bacteroidales bacterium]|nr:hypothetical protein [Bacteroidales bacterium]HPS16886.1 hypothetical protein [Bacteroidales bacterium]